MIPVQKTKNPIIRAALAAAVLSLPLSRSALAESAPEKGVVSFRYLNYNDSQPDKDRISVNALSIRGMAPIDDKWAIDVTGTFDSVSGASPSFHNTFPAPVTITTASGGSSSSSIAEEERHSLNLSLTRYLSRGTVTLGTSYSSESDYSSGSLSLQGSFYVTENKNTMLTLGASITHDTIEPNFGGSGGDGEDDGEDDEADGVLVSTATAFTDNKDIVAGLFGITQVISKNDIVQINLGYSHGTGYYSDPYKLNDYRPGKRNFTTVMARWNHFVEPLDGAARFSYRYYTDSFGIDSHTFGMEYAQSLPAGLTVTPCVRFYSQSTADFYVPANPALLPDAPNVASLEFNSFDQRLSAFGALTLGLKVQKRIDDDWLVDLRVDHFTQHSDWGINGKGDPNIAEFSANFIQLGVTTEF